MVKMLKDILKFTQVLAPVAVSASTNSTGVDVANFGSLTFVVEVGAESAGMDSASNKYDIIIQHSNVDTDGSYAACGADDFLVGAGEAGEVPASGIAKALDEVADTAGTYLVHYRGTKRSARIRLLETGTAAAPFSILAVGGHAHLNPSL